MTHTTPIQALLATIDRALFTQGVNPDLVNDDDKILLAVQYTETAMAREMMAITIPPEVQSDDHVRIRASRTT